MKTSALDSLCGVWHVANLPFDEIGLLVIRDDGRTIQFPTIKTKPRLNQTQRLWHSDYDGARIRFRPSPSANGWFRQIKWTGSGWDLIATDEDRKLSSFPCVSADLTTLPHWYPEMLEKNLKRMDELEHAQRSAEQGGAPNLLPAADTKLCDD